MTILSSDLLSVLAKKLSKELLSELWGVTCHMESHSVTCHSTQVNTPRFNSSKRLVFNLSTPEGWKAELTSVTGYMSRSLFGYNQSISQKKLCSAMCHKRIRGLYLSTDLTACGRESNLQPINHMSDILVPFIFPYSLD